MWIWKALVLGIVFIINPLIEGFALIPSEDSWKRIFVSGVFIQWGIFEVICVACTLLKTSFHTAVYLYLSILILLDIFIILTKKHHMKNKIKQRIQEKVNFKKTDKYFLVMVFVVSVLILFQALMLGIGQHEDLDDSSYITASTTTLETNSMYQYNQQTGIKTEILDLKRALSAFPQYFSFVSFVAHIHPAIAARTIYPLWAIPFAYIIYGMIGDRLFGRKILYKWIYLLFLCVFNIFGYNSIYTSSSFLLLRIWQGKATLAAIVIPFLWYQAWSVMEQEHAGGREWICLEFSVLAACMTTTMGVMLAPIISGIIACLYSIWKRNFHILWKTALCCIPCMILAGMYLFAR